MGEPFKIESRFKAPKQTIENFRKHNKTWESIKYANRCSLNGLKDFIEQSREDYDWEITVEEWLKLVDTLKKYEENSFEGFLGEPKKQILDVPENENSAWVKYKTKLENSKNFTSLSINNIENASKKIVSQLELKTDPDHPVRGLVVGNVQSGKTANMAGVIALAQDYGYNFFIVLSGTIDNLRIQTQKRLISDLDNPNCNFHFQAITTSLSTRTTYPYRLQDLSLEETSKKRYLYVCLKNSGRLDELLSWINQDKTKKSQLKILILDDEADLAGVNTANMSKQLVSKINRQIKALVFGENKLFSKSGGYCCMNYIGYTATPYANFLNEANDKSLYPCNFIATLNPPEEYIGPQQIFGVEDINEGLPIVNVIDDEEIKFIQNKGNTENNGMSKQLKESIFWFICTVACFRYWDLKKPVTMLVHTSQKIPNHNRIANLIKNFIDGLKCNQSTFDAIEKVWEEQTKKLNIDAFNSQLPDFPDISKIKKYPSFSSLKKYIESLLKNGMQHIKMNEDETNLTYGEGIHLCIDNCSSNRTTEENYVLRIIYPDKTQTEVLNKCPAFIVVGGTTLSRGLTLEGLTTSYFLRSTILADTLMQMGRWFGYRKNYELLPRLWLSSGAVNQYEHLTQLDYDLREELHNMEILNRSPKEYGPRLDTFPEFKALQVTAKNKRQKSYEIVQDFTNKKGQTTQFYSDEKIIKENYDTTISFINSLGAVNKEKISLLGNKLTNSDTLIWFEKSYIDVFNYLKKLKYPDQKATFGDYDKACEWFKNQKDNGYLNNFNIIVSSNKPSESKNSIKLENGIKINLPSRRKLKNNDDSKINLKILTTPIDRLLDINMSNFSENEIDNILNLKNVSFIERRVRFGDLNTPLLIIYIIDKDSGKNQKDTDDRVALNIKNHLAGYYIYIPYGNNGKDKRAFDSNKFTVKLEFNESDLEDEENDNED